MLYTHIVYKGKGIILLLQITTQCFEGCSHCMANASPEGEHMDKETVRASLNFIHRLKTMNVQVTGGEQMAKR